MREVRRQKVDRKSEYVEVEGEAREEVEVTVY